VDGQHFLLSPRGIPPPEGGDGKAHDVVQEEDVSTLQRYVQREFLKIFLICFSGLLSTYFLVEFFQNVDLFLDYPSPVRYKMLYFLLKMPQFIYHVTPVAVLVSVLITLGILNRNRELIAVKSSGIMLYHVCYPLVLWGLIISGLVFINNEFVVPHTERQKNFIKNVRIKGRPMRSVFRQNRVWYYGEDNTIFNIQLLDPAEEKLEGVTVFRFDPSHSRLRERVDARTTGMVPGYSVKGRRGSSGRTAPWKLPPSARRGSKRRRRPVTFRSTAKIPTA
jgi:lipopolysaccharide export system permease protein